MTRDEDEPQEIVADLVVERRIEIRHDGCVADFVTQFLELPPESLFSPQEIDGAMFRRDHEPGARLVRDARDRPLLERDSKCVLCQLLGDADVAHDPVSPAMIRACSILKIASMVARARRWASAAVMTADQAIVSAQVQARGSAAAWPKPPRHGWQSFGGPSIICRSSISPSQPFQYCL